MRRIRIAAGVGLLGAFLVSAAQPVSGDDEQAMKRFIGALGILDENAAGPAKLQQMETSTRKGFGSVVSVLPGRVVVLQTLPNTPSAKAGMSPGDEIVAVNNYRLDRLGPEQKIELLTESKQKTAPLVV